MTYVLIKGTQRVSLRLDDMRAEKISRIFQVDAASLYLTDSANVAVFPLDNGDFCSLDLNDREHYEVHGGDRAPVTPTAPATQRSFAFMQPPTSSQQVFNFTPPPRASSVRSYQRSIHLSEIKEGRLLSNQVLVVRFADVEANVPSMRDKIRSAMGNGDTYVIADVQGNEILESEGTTGVQILTRVEELLEASHGLEAVSQHINDIVSTSLGAAQRATFVTTMRQTFSCVICTGIMENPVFTAYCRSIVGCSVCVQQWMENSTLCPKCRSENVTLTEVAGLSTALDAIKTAAGVQ